MFGLLSCIPTFWWTPCKTFFPFWNRLINHWSLVTYSGSSWCFGIPTGCEPVQTRLPLQHYLVSFFFVRRFRREHQPIYRFILTVLDKICQNLGINPQFQTHPWCVFISQLHFAWRHQSFLPSLGFDAGFLTVIIQPSSEANLARKSTLNNRAVTAVTIYRYWNCWFSIAITVYQKDPKGIWPWVKTFWHVLATGARVPFIQYLVNTGIEQKVPKYQDTTRYQSSGSDLLGTCENTPLWPISVDQTSLVLFFVDFLRCQSCFHQGARRIVSGWPSVKVNFWRTEQLTNDQLGSSIFSSFIILSIVRIVQYYQRKLRSQTSEFQTTVHG